MRRIRPHLTYANVTATLALFIAISGAGAYAAEQIARKSVGAPQLRPGAVTANKLRKNAVVTPKVKAKAITTPKLATSAVDGRVLASGSVATEKIAYQAITNDKVGPDAISGDQIVESSLGQVPSAAFAATAASADSANPVAFADVDASGALVTGFSKGISQVSKMGTGAYCITASTLSPRGAQATAREIGDGTVSAYAIVGGGGCASPKVLVQTYAGDPPVPTNERFYVVLYG